MPLDYWLSTMQQDTRINVLSIPGTHDAASYTALASAVGSAPLTYTQQIDILAQLNSGVRVLDMRVAFYKPYIGKECVYMCHGPMVFSIDLSGQLKTIKRWLGQNSSEFVAMIFQQQGTKSSDAKEQARQTKLIMKDITDVFDAEWTFSPGADTNDWPTVGELKKKVMIFSRLENDLSGVFDLRAWRSGDGFVTTDFDVTGTNLKIALQDRYTKVTNTDLTKHLNTKGWTNDVGEINKAKFLLFEKLHSQDNDDATLKINHLSHSLKSPSYRQPYMLGTDLNKRLKASLENPDKRYRGFVMIDDAEESVCRSIIDSNLIYRRDSRPPQLYSGLGVGRKESLK